MPPSANDWSPSSNNAWSREDDGGSSFGKVVYQLRPMWVPILFGSISAGILMPNISYIGMNFFAQQYTELRPDEIHCEDTPDEYYCKAAVNDNLFWGAITGAAGSVLHFLLGPILGALSDAKGRRPVIVFCSLAGFPSLLTLLLLVYRNLSLYYTFALLPFSELPVLAVWFAYIVDLIEDQTDTSKAFGIITAATTLSAMIGYGLGTVLSLKGGVTAMAVVDIGILLPYLVLLLPETLPESRRRPVKWADSAPGIGLSILVRNGLFARLSTVVIGSTLIGSGFQRVSTSFLQKYITWPKSANNKAMGIAMISSILWSSCGLVLASRRLGDVGVLGLALVAGALYMLMFAFVQAPWQVFVLNGLLLGPQALAFPATSAIKSRLVAEDEQGLLQGALNTGKSIAEALGPLLFGVLFEWMSNEQPRGSRAPIFAAFALSLPLLVILWRLPDMLKHHEDERLQASGRLKHEEEDELAKLDAEDVSLLDSEQRGQLL